MREIKNDENVIDSRDIIERIEWLVDLVMDEEMNGYLPDADQEDITELEMLRALHNEGKDEAEDWQHGATLIRESYFTEYAKQLADDTGVFGDLFGHGEEIPWPFTHIDWEAAAQELLVDYTELNFGGVTYYCR